MNKFIYNFSDMIRAIKNLKMNTSYHFYCYADEDETIKIIDKYKKQLLPLEIKTQFTVVIQINEQADFKNLFGNKYCVNVDGNVYQKIIDSNYDNIDFLFITSNNANTDLIKLIFNYYKLHCNVYYPGISERIGMRVNVNINELYDLYVIKKTLEELYNREESIKKLNYQ